MGWERVEVRGHINSNPFVSSTMAYCSGRAVIVARADESTISVGPLRSTMQGQSRRDYFFLLRFSFSRNFAIRLIRPSGRGLSRGKCTEPLACLYGASSFLNAAIPEVRG